MVASYPTGTVSYNNKSYAETEISGLNDFDGSYQIDSNYYGTNNNSLFIVNAQCVELKITSILLGGGGSGSYTDTTGKDGGHALIISSPITFLYIDSTAALLGGGGGGGNLVLNDAAGYPGFGAPGGGGGGGLYWSTTGYSGGSFVLNSNTGYGGNGENAPGGGGPGGGPGGYTSNNGYAANGGSFNTNNGLYVGGNSGVFQNRAGPGGGYGGGNGGNAGTGGNSGGGGGGGGGYGGSGTSSSVYVGYSGGNGGYGIYCSEEYGLIDILIQNLHNSQGGNNPYGPLFFGAYKSFITNYYIVLIDQSRYGQIYYTGWAVNNNTITTYPNVNISYKSSYNGGSTIFKSVIVGNFSSMGMTSYTQVGTTTYYTKLVKNVTKAQIGSHYYDIYDLYYRSKPSAPTISISYIGNATVTITYSSNGDGGETITDYTLYYYQYLVNGSDVTTSIGTSGSVNLYNLTNGSLYVFKLKAVNEVGSSSYTNDVEATPYTFPSAPTNVTLAITASSTTITATITQGNSNGNGLNGYYYAINGTSYGSKITPYPSNNQFTFTGSYGISYYVNVIVVNDAGNSGEKTSNTIKPYTYPVAPTINSIAPSNGSVTLTYEINSNNGNDITGNTFTYGSVTFNAGYTNVNFTTIGTANPTSSPYTLSVLTNGTPYYFKLTSSNDAGPSSDTIFTKYVTPTPSPFKGYSETYSNAMTISTGDNTGYNTNFNTDATNNYGHYLYFISDVTTFTNSGNIYAAGGGTNIISGAPIVYNGGHAIYIAPSITIQTLKNYGNLLGGGGGGVSTNTGRVGGYGGAGGGGGGLATTNSRGENGSENGGAGGGGGAGGSYSVSTYIPGVTSTDGGGGYGGGNSTNGGGGGGGGNSTTGGKGGYSIYNGGNITSLYNSQGGSSSKGPLFYAGNMPTNYYIRLNSANNYGQLYYTGWGATTSISSLNMNIQIDTDSNTFDSGTTFPAVLVGNFANIDTTSKAATGNLYYWNLSRNGTTTVSGVSTYVVYDLVITATDNRPSSGTGIITASSLSLSGYVGSTINQNYISSINNANTIATNTGNLISATAAYRIASGVGFTINSDKRIKKNMEPLSSSASLQIVKALKPSSFQYVDFMKGGVSKYGYLAQEVEAVIPNVVNRNAAYIPNFFEIVEIEGQNKIGLKEKTTESLEIGTKLQFYDIHNNVLYREVGEIVDEKTFIISEPLLEIDLVFLYGQFVDDYRSIDNDQINTVLLSALQECSKKIERQEQKLDDLEKLLEEL